MRFLKNKQIIFSIFFITVGIATQLIAYAVANDGWLSLISGITGILAVVLCAERKLSFYVFAWIQLITYVILAYEQRLYAELASNAFYAITMIFGMFIWFKNAGKNKSEVTARHLSKRASMLINGANLAFIVLTWLYLKNYTDDTQPFIDSLTTIPAIIAQILMILCYREQWWYWLIIDIASIYMWYVADNWCMVMQYIFWSANCIYGTIKWK